MDEDTLKLDPLSLNQPDISNSNPQQEVIGEPTQSNQQQEIGFKETIVLELPSGLKLTLGSNTFTTYGLMLQAKELIDYATKPKSETKPSTYTG
jgi:hypothetical protein